MLSLVTFFLRLTLTIVKGAFRVVGWVVGGLVRTLGPHLVRALRTRAGQIVAAALVGALLLVRAVGGVAGSPVALRVLGGLTAVALVAAGWQLRHEDTWLRGALRHWVAKIRPLAWLRGEQARRVGGLNADGARMSQFGADVKALSYDRRKALQAGRVSLGRMDVKTHRGAPMSQTWLAVEPERHTLVLAPTRSGKTASVLLPNLLGPGLAGACVVVTDPKGELLRDTFGYRSQLGPVTVFDPNGVQDDIPTNTWSLLQWLRRAPDVATLGDRARDRALDLAEKAGAGAENANFFRDQAKGLLRPMLIAAAWSPAGGLGDILRWTNRQGAAEDVAQVRDLLADYVAAGGDADVLDEWDGFAALDERGRTTAYSTLGTVMGRFAGSRVKASQDTGPGTVPFEAGAFLSQPGTHYLVGDETTVRQLSNLYVAHLTELLVEARQAAARNGGRLPVPLVLVLEEATNMACLPTLPVDMSLDAGRGIHYLLVAQSIEAMEGVWNANGTETMIGNCAAVLLLAGTHSPRSQAFVRGLGSVKVTEENTNVGADGKVTGKGRSVREQQLLGDHVLAGMPKGQGILRYTGAPLVELTTDYYADNPAIMARISAPEAAWREDLAAGLVRPPGAAAWSRPPAVGVAAWLQQSWDRPPAPDELEVTDYDAAGLFDAAQDAEDALDDYEPGVAWVTTGDGWLVNPATGETVRETGK